jgi:site-specific DNA-methyltransferase (adenine-specific)
MPKATFLLAGHNPDVLNCIANLSNDKVFTPPEFANRMLDSLEMSWAESNRGQSIWENSELTFLDPGAKSGVYLREIVKRLNIGLSKKIPDLSERINHIFEKQVFGIGTEIVTSMIARRSIYCSKLADGIHSVARVFANPAGNIWFERTEHSWVRERCSFCGASQDQYERDSALESHAYAFIHTNDIQKTIANMFGERMRFDVIIGNPPYQLSDGGASASARPIYHQFIEQAKRLDPRYIVMVTPSRWFAGGKGLDEFRRNMLSDNRLRVIVDYIQEKDAFPKVNINGGVNYFLWDRDHLGDCQITTIAPGGKTGETISRSLNEHDIFVRRNEAIPILNKVLSKKEPSFFTRVSSRKPFGLPTDFHGGLKESTKRNIKLYGSGRVSWVSEIEIPVNTGWIDKWKVMIPRASDGNENYPLPIWDQAGPFVAAPGEACTETYLVASLARTKKEAEFIAAYMRTRFFRFMVSLRKGTQDNKASLFTFVPEIPLDKMWTDEELFDRYGINLSEIEFIQSIVREVNFTNA